MTSLRIFVIVFSIVCFITQANGFRNIFPENFKFGVATSSYQIEGAWDDDGKGLNIWDEFTHKNPYGIVDHTNGDVATDSYHLYKRDVEMIKELGVHFYRFSLSWSRLLPTGYANEINAKAVKYYDNLIDELLKAGIEPHVTIYHWDLPQSLQDLGGWTNPIIIQLFEDYANVVFTHFGDRVKLWMTFNEPKMICNSGYGGDNLAPAVNATGIGNYLCMHNLLLSHAKAYRLYRNMFWSKFGGRVGVVVSFKWSEPLTNSSVNYRAAEDARIFDAGHIFDPLNFGDYPAVLKNRIAEKSLKQGFPRSRLPVFSDTEKTLLKASIDFMGVNYYTSMYIYRNGSEEHKYVVPSAEDDLSVIRYQDPKWPKSASSWLSVTPWGLRRVLNWLKNRYTNKEILITENGFSTRGGLNDQDRIFYLKSHVKTLLDAIHEDGCNVTGYTHWSLMDNFEWMRGYTEAFGLYEVDFDHANRTRTPRKSAQVYKSIIKQLSVDRQPRAEIKLVDDDNTIEYLLDISAV